MARTKGLKRQRYKSYGVSWHDILTPPYDFDYINRKISPEDFIAIMLERDCGDLVSREIILDVNSQEYIWGDYPKIEDVPKHPDVDWPVDVEKPKNLWATYGPMRNQCYYGENEYNDKMTNWRFHQQYFPKIRKKLIRKLLNREWLVESHPNVFKVTQAGKDAFEEYLYQPSRETLFSKGRKGRPQGKHLTFSRYRWKVQGRNRGGSKPQPAPHIKLREQEERTRLQELAEEAEQLRLRQEEIAKEQFQETMKAAERRVNSWPEWQRKACEAALNQPHYYTDEYYNQNRSSF